MSRPQSRWQDAHLNLKRLYEARVPRGMSQEEFGALYDIGTQGMVSQYLNGTRPLNFEAAAKFARGLNCTIQDISPDMAAALQREILPVLGLKALAKAAVLLLAICTTLPYPTHTQAADFAKNDRSAYYVQSPRRRFSSLPGYAEAVYRILRSSINLFVAISHSGRIARCP